MQLYGVWAHDLSHVTSVCVYIYVYISTHTHWLHVSFFLISIFEVFCFVSSNKMAFKLPKKRLDGGVLTWSRS